MTMAYIRKTYGVPAKRGVRVRVKTQDGWSSATITCAKGQYLVVRPDAWPNARPKFHPDDVDFEVMK
jgi:aminoglycoside phosphotransferase (APT) family kinase protein